MRRNDVEAGFPSKRNSYYHNWLLVPYDVPMGDWNATSRHQLLNDETSFYLDFVQVIQFFIQISTTSSVQ